MSDSSDDHRPEETFLATASHEIRTPLNGILGTVSLLLETELQPAQREYAEAIHQSGARLLDLLNNVLDYARLDAGAMEIEPVMFQPSALAHEVAELLSPRAHSAGLDIAVREFPGVPILARGDAGRIRQILFNLVGNALKFTEAGGILIELEATGTDVSYAVIDTGPGIAPEDRENLFKAFRQASPGDSQKDGGVGLGLAIVSRLTEALGGKIEIEGEPGLGTTFRVTLPLTDISMPSEPALHPALTGTRIGLAGLPVATLLGVSTKLQALGCVPVTLDVENTDVVREVSVIIANAALPERVIMALSRIAPCMIVLRPEDRGVIPRFRALGCRGWLVRPLRPSSLEERLRFVLDGAVIGADDERGLSGNGGHVLIADDNPVNALIARRALEKSGFTSTVAATGSEAVEAISNMDHDLILMDLRMPVMDGFEAMQHIRATGNTIPIIAISAEITPDIERRARQCGADAVASKPLDPESLRTLARKWTQNSQGENAA